MQYELSPDTIKHIRELCGTISVAHNLDEEIQRELFSHMEDKIRAYLSGAEKLSEDDAFVLVREHFGDPEEVKAMLENVHAEAVRIGLARRIGAALIATLGIGVFVYMALYISQFLVHLVFGAPTKEVRWWSFLYMVLNPVILYIVLKRWRKDEKTGDRKWYHSLSPLMFIVVIGALFVADTIVHIAYFAAHYHFLHTLPFYLESFLKGYVSIGLTHHPDLCWTIDNLLSRHYSLNFKLFPLITLISLLAQGGIWLYWCDGVSRSLFSRVSVVSAWVAFVFLTAAYQPSTGFKHDAAGQVITSINWHRHITTPPHSTIYIIIFGAGILMLYILAGKILDKTKRIRNHEIV